MPFEQQQQVLEDLQQQHGAGSPEMYTAIIERFVPAREIEFDMRGRSDIVRGQFAYIDVGECKSSADYSKAVAQLGLRLGALRWMAQACFGVPQHETRLVGRIFVPRAGNKSAFAGADAAQQHRALIDWGFSLYVHFV